MKFHYLSLNCIKGWPTTMSPTPTMSWIVNTSQTTDTGFHHHKDGRRWLLLFSWWGVYGPIFYHFVTQSMKGFLFFLPLKQGAELELKDSRGWTALFHCTSTGHQQMVKFLLDNNADANVKLVSSFIPKLLRHFIQTEVFITFSFIHREPGAGFTPLMEATASGHEIIVQFLLDHVRGFLPTHILSKTALQHQEMR